MERKPRVIIIGAGFGGLYAARTLANQSVEVLLVDRNNFHTFSPLLYQVATCALDPSSIAYPVRTIFRRAPNVHFMLGEVRAIDWRNKSVVIRTNGVDRSEYYDYLIVAAGSVTHTFDQASLESYAFGLKSLDDAIALRHHILRLFEKAAWLDDVQKRSAMTTLVVVGGGPTGIETAGALYELYNHVIAREYAEHGGLKARVILVEATTELLSPYPPKLRAAAKEQLESLGVEVIIGKGVASADYDHVRLSDGTVIPTYTIVWSAGVKASPVAHYLGVPLQKGGRIPILPTLEVEGCTDVYAVGDIAYLEDANGQPYPMLIPPAKQQGILAAKNILARLKGESQKPFRYIDRGIMATIGRSRAVAWIYYRIPLTGFVAWLGWLFLHLIMLMGFRNRVSTFINWVWNYLTYDRSVRLILDRMPTHRDISKSEIKEKMGE